MKPFALLKPLDLLIITPLPDEEWACLRWFKGTTVAELSNLKWMPHPSGASIGLHAFNGMGSLFAATQTAPLLHACRPKYVLLLGIAAGRPFRAGGKRQGGGFNLGDVAYNKSIYYCSYGKVKGRKLPKIRAVTPIPQNEELARWVREIEQQGDWKNTARAWFNDSKNEWRRQFSFPRQRWPIYELKGHAADFGSGELVVASEDYQKAVRSQYGTADITVFEMEAYAVGSVCQALHIPFLTVRGISDHGKITKNDEYRLAAALAPSAIVDSLLKNSEIVAQIRKADFPLYQVHTPCLLPKTPIPCPHDRSPESRKCIDLGITIRSAQPALLTRALEHVEPPDYSRSLNDRLKRLDGKRERVVFFFPYSAKATARWCVEEEGSDLFEELKEIIYNPKYREHGTAEYSRIVELTEQIATIGRRLYPHFQACEELCKRLRETRKINRDNLPRTISRVIITSEDLNEFAHDPVNLIYSFLLGTETVPTFLMSDQHTKTKVRDDITFFENTNNHGDNLSFNWLKAVRFFPSSWLLLTTGWPCESSGEKTGGESTLVHMSGLYSEWKSSVVLETPGHVVSGFSTFPHDDLRRIVGRRIGGK
jgi:nucleoside phosphorylase